MPSPVAAWLDCFAGVLQAQLQLKGSERRDCWSAHCPGAANSPGGGWGSWLWPVHCPHWLPGLCQPQLHRACPLPLDTLQV